MATSPVGRQAEFAGSYIPQSDQALGPVYPALADSVLRRIPLDMAGKTVLDLGGGIGQWVEELLARGLGTGILLDEDAEMVDHARKAWGGAAAEPARRWIIRGRAEAIPLRPGCIDLVVSRNSMHLWQDLPQAWLEIGRILAPGGWIFIGRGFGPDLPEEIRQQVKQARRALRGPGEALAEEPRSPEASVVAELAARAGICREDVIPDHKSWWFLGRRRG